MRRLRAWFYRRLPSFAGIWHRKRRSGYERRWNLEKEGFTKEGFFQIFSTRFGLGKAPGLLVELAAGDGLVGSLGLWLEEAKLGWKVCAWEHRPEVLRQLRKNRPATEIREGRLTCWKGVNLPPQVLAVTTRGAREAAGLCRAIRQETIRPRWLGIWNPSQRPVWHQRLRREGYRLKLVWQNLEFYVDGRRGSGLGGRGTRAGSEESGDRGQGLGVRKLSREK